MKLNGIVGKGSGKLGASVWSISGGEQVVRAYNPQVTNPSTDAQVAQRAKLKLLSQLAAALAPGLGFKKIGLVSARNQFVSKNIGAAQYDEGVARITLTEIKLTPGMLTLGQISVGQRTGNNVACTISDVDAAYWDRVIYVSAKKSSDEKLTNVTVTQAVAGDNNDFAASVYAPDNGSIIYAYGVKFHSSGAKSRYENYDAAADVPYAELLAMLSNMFTNATLSDTCAHNILES